MASARPILPPSPKRPRTRAACKLTLSFFRPKSFARSSPWRFRRQQIEPPARRAAVAFPKPEHGPHARLPAQVRLRMARAAPHAHIHPGLLGSRRAGAAELERPAVAAQARPQTPVQPAHAHIHPGLLGSRRAGAAELERP